MSQSQDTTDNVIQLPNAGANPVQPPTRPKLEFNEAIKIGGALERLAYLSQQSVITREAEAETRGLNQHLDGVAKQYLPELLGAWFVVETEYDPLVGSIAALLRRSGAVNARDAAQK